MAQGNANGALPQRQIQTGSFVENMSGSATQYYKTITFDEPFDHVPSVSLSISDSIRGYSSGGPRTVFDVSAVTTTDFRIMVTTASIASGPITVRWIAI